jgi:hypothetical protein
MQARHWLVAVKASIASSRLRKPEASGHFSLLESAIYRVEDWAFRAARDSGSHADNGNLDSSAEGHMRKLESLNSHIPESNESDAYTPVFHAELVFLEQLSFRALKTLDAAAPDPEDPKLERTSICCCAPGQLQKRRWQ